METKTRVLVVDDEADLRDLVSYNLKEAGFHVVAVGTGRDALVEAARQRPDFIVLDLMLPDMSGTDVCKKLRQQAETRNTPVLMLTAKDTEIDRVVGFEVGADDYVTKPFSPRELVLRIQAILRRSVNPPPPSEGPIELGVLRIDIGKHEVYVEGEPLALTALEFRLLVDLVERRGRVQTRDALLDRVWGYSPDVETRTVDTHVKRLREKLGMAGDYIETIRGVGYRVKEGI